MFKLISFIGILTFGISDSSATSCHELHQSQLTSLNERMNQMIDTISTLLPKPLKKPKVPVPSTPTSSNDYPPSAPTYDTPYAPPSVYPSLPPTPQIMYVTPSYSPLPAPVTAPAPIIAPSPMQPNSMPLLPSYYPQTPGLPVDYAFLSTSNIFPQFSRLQYRYENMPIPVPVSNPSPPLYPPIPFSPIQQYPSDYNHPYPPEYPLTVPLYPNMPSYPPGQPHFPLPIYTMQPPRYT